MATITNISSKYRDIVSKCTQLHSGSPAVYQLKPKKEMFGTMTRKIVGEKIQGMINKTILLVGETGTGKSTLINALVNYTMGVKFEDNVCFEIVEEEKKSQTESQTSDVTVYEILGFKDLVQPYSLTIIDTPGYGDTRGIDHDEKLKERLLDLFRSEDGVRELHAVGVVMKASDNRLSDRLMYIFNSVTSLFGKDLQENIVLLVTHSDGVTAQNLLQAVEDANIKCALNKKNQPVHFMFNNRQTTERTEDNELGINFAWGLTEKGMKQFSDFLKNATAQKLSKTSQVLNTIVGVTACITNLKQRIEFIEEKQKAAQETQEVLKKYEQEMKNNEKFVVSVPETYKVKTPFKGGMWGLFYSGVTVCTNCEENCHYPDCTMAWYPKDCEVMKGGRCTSCTNKCPVSHHVKEEWFYEVKTRTVQTTKEEMKKKYYKKKADSEKEADVLKCLQNEINDLMVKKDEEVEESYQHILTLEQISLNINSASTYVDYDFLIEKMKEKRDTRRDEKVQKLEKMKKEMNQDEKVMTGLRYRRNQLGNAGKKV